MIGRTALSGVWTWSVWQPDRGFAFNSYLFERAGGTVAVDPLALDADSVTQIERMGGVRTIVLTNRDHRREAQALRERFGARVVAHAPEADLFDVPIDATFAGGDEVFEGAVAVAIPHGKTEGEIALHFPAESAALVGDAIIGAPAGSLSLLPDEKLRDPAALAYALRELWALQLDSLLLCDGTPLWNGADAALGALLESRLGAEANRVNANDLGFVHDDPHAGFESYDKEIGLLIGARELGYRLSMIPPGKAFCPLHSHMAEEEFYYVIEGTPSVRTPRGTLRCKPGDFIAFPTGARGTHQLRNDSEAGCLILMVGASARDEVCDYPESGKVLVDVRGRPRILRASPLLDYWDGE